mgnify:CR=1 FL=1
MSKEEKMQGCHEILAKAEAALKQVGVTPDKIYWLSDPEEESQHVVGENYKLVISFGEESPGFNFSRTSLEDFPSGTSAEAEATIRYLVDTLSGQ